MLVFLVKGSGLLVRVRVSFMIDDLRLEIS